ncbi:Macrolide-specific efflux protein macA precursor [Leminorella richardii]|uniref:Macrolide-specific efflux protein macA n=1 Tax=Leminorella richardii TaxID=158841 RepID=A0A2X4UU68_9GAMM|nr:efflux RND transporter periplasmic adaptor subunit [Leminorella richardii]SQI36560.1 Macrolide-specific efflux protein macA precursor [Leminorella richardii]
MKKRLMNKGVRFFHRWIWRTALILSAAYAIHYAAAQQTEPTSAPPAVENTALTVSTLSPRAMTWSRTLLATGSIAAWQEAFISTEAHGVSITSVLVDVGDEVRKGQLLAELQSQTLSAELEQAEAELRQAIAQREEARADAQRVNRLQTSAAISAQQATQYRVTEKIANARVAALEAKVKAARYRVEQTNIVAPDDGTVTERLATLGHVVSSGDVLFKLNRQNRMEWHAELPADDLALIQAGQRVTLSIAELAPVNGQVRQIAPTIDKNTRNGRVYIDLQPSSVVRAGSFATGKIVVGHSQVIAVPESALLLHDGYAYVFRVKNENRVQRIRVVTGVRQEGWVAITEGLQTDDVIVADGGTFLSDGDSVRIVSHQDRSLEEK